jgi:hypothetical protein
VKFKKSKYTDPNELVIFNKQLTDAIANLNSRRNNALKPNQGNLSLELWPLVHHTTYGNYYTFTNTSTTKFWIGLDFAEEGIALLIWFDNPDPSLISKLLGNLLCSPPVTSHYDTFGRYQRGKINQFWLALKEAELDTIQNTPAQAQKIIEDFLDEVLDTI